METKSGSALFAVWLHFCSCSFSHLLINHVCLTVARIMALRDAKKVFVFRLKCKGPGKSKPPAKIVPLSLGETSVIHSKSLSQSMIAKISAFLSDQIQESRSSSSYFLVQKHYFNSFSLLNTSY